jgi:hypothetical protein
MKEERIKFAPEEAMRESLVQRLRGGSLEACGVQLPPKQGHKLEVLPAHFFIQAKINWDKNKVTSFGVTYDAVQVRRRPYVPRTSAVKALNVAVDASSGALEKPIQTTSDATATRADARNGLTTPIEEESSPARRQRPGPPSGEAEVVAIFDRLLQKGILTEGMTVKEIYNKLLPDLKRNSKIFPNGRGLAYSSIARHLRPILRSKFSSWHDNLNLHLIT